MRQGKNVRIKFKINKVNFSAKWKKYPANYSRNTYEYVTLLTFLQITDAHVSIHKPSIYITIRNSHLLCSPVQNICCPKLPIGSLSNSKGAQITWPTLLVVGSSNYSQAPQTTTPHHSTTTRSSSSR
jgi:hypothetical protein